MIVDTSVLAAIAFGEPNRELFLEILDESDDLKISSATVVEASIVIQMRYGDEYAQDLHNLLADVSCLEIAFTGEHRRWAEYGYRNFGKGRGKEPAALNMGDCYSYGLAKATGEPLLFQGKDFSKTDLSWIDLETGDVTRNPKYTE